MSDPYGVVTGEPIRSRSSRSGRPRRVWLQGGTSTQAWDWDLVAWAIAALAAGIAAAILLPDVPGLIWLVMLAPVVIGFRRSIPRGLLRFRAHDLLLGIVLGLALRVISGWMAPLTTWPTADSWWTDVLAPALVAPAVEELFFHGLLLVALYTAFRRASRSRLAAGTATALITTALFVLTHLLTDALDDHWSGPASIALVALAGALLVLLTGRIWSALVMHVAFNASYVSLGLIALLATGDTGGAGLT
ncbi:CPBP family glutamic-type intramembrane protease [Aeromicrobium piscarium]|uniref:CPBP family glutamic-type intramembrane protease n=1 Tax=Aeromicrobium piscarium TaxID=2590901 RepID=UPI00163D625F|nr:CPBP family glutamic-type intramembrane protease [Aeromicrobium piscarium]